MAPEYGLSKFGRPIVIAEDPQSTLRFIFVAITALVGAISIFYVYRLYIRLRTKQIVQCKPHPSSCPPLVNLTFVVLLINIFIHTAHYADNIYRPIDYFEPKYMYQKYVLETMEITFFANFPILLLGTLGITKLFDFQNGKLITDKSGGKLLIGFILGSLLTVMHYRIEPPTSYGADVNFTIAGEGVMAISLLILVVVSLRKAKFVDGTVQGNENIEMEKLLEEDTDQEPAVALGNVTRRSPRQKRQS